jgi:uncharacterized protein YjbJ (UPF0337 family)
MNRDTAEGKFDEVKGKVKQSIGETLGDEKLANSGAADQVKGSAKEAWGKTKEALHAVTDDAESKGNDIRSRITSTAQNAKDAVSEKMDDIKGDRKRSA